MIKYADNITNADGLPGSVKNRVKKEFQKLFFSAPFLSKQH